MILPFRRLLSVDGGGTNLGRGFRLERELINMPDHYNRTKLSAYVLKHHIHIKTPYFPQNYGILRSAEPLSAPGQDCCPSGQNCQNGRNGQNGQSGPGPVVRQASLPLAMVEAMRKGSILKTPATSKESRSRSISRNSSRSTKTIRFQRQSSFDHGSYGYEEPGVILENAWFSREEEEEEELELGLQSDLMTRRATLLREPSSFTGDEIMSMKAAFAKLDVNGDGQLSHAEVHTALGEMMPEEDIESLLKEMDADGDGQIDYQEFLMGMKKKVKEPESVKMLKEAFKVFDLSGSGLVSKDLMRITFMNTGNSSSLEVDEMLTVLDGDNDGNIELEDFLRIFIENPSYAEVDPPVQNSRCAIL